MIAVAIVLVISVPMLLWQFRDNVRAARRKRESEIEIEKPDNFRKGHYPTKRIRKLAPLSDEWKVPK